MATALDRKTEKIVSELEEAFPSLLDYRSDWDHDTARNIVAEWIPLIDDNLLQE